MKGKKIFQRTKIVLSCVNSKEMKGIGRNFSLILVGLGGVFFLWNFVSSICQHQKRKEIPLSLIGAQAREKRPFVFLLPKEASKKTLESVHTQIYPHYRIVFLETGSSEQLQLAIQACLDEEILIFLSKDDWLAHEEVLKLVNLCYEDPNIWLTYGNYVLYPSYKKGGVKSKPYLSPLHTGYAGIFKKILTKDLQQGSVNGFFLPASQMAQGHLRYIPDVLYVQKQRECFDQSEWEAIESIQAYAPLNTWRNIR